MSDTLPDLMRSEASGLAVPPVPTVALLARGRNRRRRRRVALVGGVVGTCLAVTAAAVAVDALTSGPHPDRGTSDTSHVATTYAGATFAIGTSVYTDDGRLRVEISDTAIKSLFYTSAGVLVRHGDNANSDPGGPERFSLVTPSGLVRPLSVHLEETVPSTDPRQPYLAYAVVDAGVVHVKVVDVRDESVAADVAVPEAKQWGGWVAPPVSLDGDLVYLGTSDVTRVVDWRTGALRTSNVVPPGFPVVHGSATITTRGGRPAVVDAQGGSVLLLVRGDTLGLSPDGRFASSRGTGDIGGDASIGVHDLGTGAVIYLDLGSDWGWGPDDTLFSVTEGSSGYLVRTCNPVSGHCATSAPRLGQPAPTGELRLGGVAYES